MENTNLYEMTSLGSALMAPIEKEVLAGKLVIRDGKVHFTDIILPHGPWVRYKADPARDCARWLHIYFKYYGVIPKRCFHCWKIVCRVDQLDQLMELMEIQKDVDIPAKAGLEQRQFLGVGKRYVALWYAPLGGGLDLARKIHKEIEARVQEKLGFQHKVHLKRACSEMEHKYGDSDKWTYAWTGLEAVLDEFFVGNVTLEDQPKQVRDAIIHRWIERAWEMGDPSVWKFAKKEHFPGSPVFYERTIHRAKDFELPMIEVEEPSGLITELH